MSLGRTLVAVSAAVALGAAGLWAVERGDARVVMLGCDRHQTDSLVRDDDVRRAEPLPVVRRSSATTLVRFEDFEMAIPRSWRASGHPPSQLPSSTRGSVAHIINRPEVLLLGCADGQFEWNQLRSDLVMVHVASGPPLSRAVIERDTERPLRLSDLSPNPDVDDDDPASEELGLRRFIGRLVAGGNVWMVHATIGPDASAGDRAALDRILASLTWRPAPPTVVRSISAPIDPSATGTTRRVTGVWPGRSAGAQIEWEAEVPAGWHAYRFRAGCSRPARGLVFVSAPDILREQASRQDGADLCGARWDRAFPRDAAAVEVVWTGRAAGADIPLRADRSAFTSIFWWYGTRTKVVEQRFVVGGEEAELSIWTGRDASRDLVSEADRIVASLRVRAR